MSWQMYRLDGALGAHRDSWDALNGKRFAAHPYFDSRFIEPLLRYFGAGTEHLCVGTLAGAPECMLIVKPDGFGKWSLFVPAQAQVAPILAGNAAALATLVPQLSWRALALNCPCQDPQYSPVADAAGLPMTFERRAHTISVGLDASFEAYWQERSANLRKSTARRVRRVQDAGLTMRLEHLTAGEQMRGAIQRFGALESVGWKGPAGTAVHIDNVQGRFYSQVMSGFAAAGQASVYELYFNDALVAMQLALVSPAMLVLLKTTYDESQAALSPGRLLLQQVLKHEFGLRRCRSVEFYTNADSNQLAWATGERWIADCMIFRSPLVRRIYELRERSRRRHDPVQTPAEANGANHD